MLEKQDQAKLFDGAGFALRNLGRLSAALQPTQQRAILCVKSKDWKLASSAASSLNALLCTMGKLDDALIYAEDSVGYATQSSDIPEEVQALARLADTLKDMGRNFDAHATFLKAETLQARNYPNRPMLYEFPGANFCDLLLEPCESACWKKFLAIPPSQGMKGPVGDTYRPAINRFGVNSQSFEEILSVVEHRANCSLDWAEDDGKLIDKSLASLMVFRVAFYRQMLQSTVYPLKTDRRAHLLEANNGLEPMVDQAITRVRSAQFQNMVINALLNRAWLRILTGVHEAQENAQSDLNEAWDIAERGPMRLHMTKIHLYRVRLFFRETIYPWGSPAADFSAARKLIEQCSYWRRKEELEDAETALRQQHS